MRPTPVLYIETSVFGFYFDEGPHNSARRQAVIALFNQLARGAFRAVTSPLTAEELQRAREPLRTRATELLADVEPVRLDADDVERLAGQYVSAGIIPPGYADDARHAASATIAGTDVLVSLNLRHLANEWAERKLNAVNLREGYRMIRIRTPEEVLQYED